jgi:hypothetical protein
MKRHIFGTAGLIGKKAIRVSVLKQIGVNGHPVDSTNNGVSGKVNELLMVVPDGYITITEENIDEVVNLEITPQGWRRAIPLRLPDNVEKRIGPMMGGNFIYTSDSRFSKLNNGLPIPIHDRYETQRDYDILSR